MSSSRPSFLVGVTVLVFVLALAPACSKKSTSASPKPTASTAAESPAGSALGSPEGVAGKTACQAYIDGHQQFPDFSQLPKPEALKDPGVQEQIENAAALWANATRTIGACTAENGELDGGDVALAQLSAGLSIALASSRGYAPPDGDPRIAAEIDYAMNAIRNSYPDSCWVKLADGWDSGHVIDAAVGQSCAKSG